MRVAIVGYGFVGKALFNALNETIEVQKIDPKINTSISQLNSFKPDIIFICVPTPMSNEGTQDISIVTNTLSQISELDISGLVVIKSTVHPGNISEIEKNFPSFVYNPEFLREKFANDDFINSNLIVFGGKSSSTKKLANFYLNCTKCINKNYIHTDPVAASLIKYSINSFLATKVIFFNELKNLFSSTKTDEDWVNFIDYVSRDKRIGNSHMMVPGHDGRYGFGGACLPKDSSAILNYANSLGIDMTVIKNVINTNNKIRASYNDQTFRENEQNIKYDNQKEE